MIGYHSTDASATQYFYAIYICNECKTNTYKIIGIAGENHGEKMRSLYASW